MIAIFEYHTIQGYFELKCSFNVPALRDAYYTATGMFYSVVQHSKKFVAMCDG